MFCIAKIKAITQKNDKIENFLNRIIPSSVLFSLNYAEIITLYFKKLFKIVLIN